MSKNVKKITTRMIFIFVMLFIGVNHIEALEKKDIKGDNFINPIPVVSIQNDILVTADKNIFVLAGGGAANCDELISGDTKAFLNKIFGYVKIFAPLLVLIFGMLDFIKATVSQDNDALKKAGTKFFKRLAAAVLLFVFPALIQFLLDIVSIPGVVNYCKM